MGERPNECEMTLVIRENLQDGDRTFGHGTHGTPGSVGSVGSAGSDGSDGSDGRRCTPQLALSKRSSPLRRQHRDVTNLYSKILIHCYDSSMEASYPLSEMLLQVPNLIF